MTNTTKKDECIASSGKTKPAPPDAAEDEKISLMGEIIALRKANSDLLKRNNELRENSRQLRLNLSSVEAERDQRQHEASKYKAELHQLKNPPLIVGIIEQNLKDGRVVVRSTTGPCFVSRVSKSIGQDKLIAGAQCGMNSQSFAVVEILPNKVDTQVSAMEIDHAPNVTYDDIGGLEKQKELLKEAIELPLTRPELFEKTGIEPPKGVLFYGEPGTGKTLLAKAAAHETNASFIRVVGSELVQKYIGEGARLVREIFSLAREKAPAIIFIDEIDAVGTKRTVDAYSAGDHEVGRTLMQLLAELDGFNPRGNIKIIAATNRRDMLDSALLRPGRFDRIIEFPLPNEEERESILAIHTKKMHLSKSVSLKDLVGLTDGFNGAEIAALSVEAGMQAIRSNRSTIQLADFKTAVEMVKKGRDTQEQRPEIPNGVYL